MSTIDQMINEAERILNYVFINKALCVEAIQMAAPQVKVLFNGGRSIIQNNKRLAVLGDSALSFALCKKWYEAEPRQLPNAWTAARQQVLSNTGLEQRSRPLGIGAIIITEAGYDGPASTKMLITTLEALIGAIYQEAGEAVVVSVIEHLGLDNHPSLMVTFNTFSFGPHSEAEKTILQLVCQLVGSRTRQTPGDVSTRLMDYALDPDLGLRALSGLALAYLY